MVKKKKDPEAPYSDNPTPGKPGWNLAKGKKKDKEAPYSDNPTPGKPGWNIAKKRGPKTTSFSLSQKGTIG